MPTELFKLLPPTTQSDVETMTCPVAYLEMVVKGNRAPYSAPAERGKEVHHVMGEYAKHCAALQVRSDWKFFNELTQHVGHDDAGPILDGVRDRYVVQWDRFYGAEIPMALDEDFNPTRTVHNSNRYTTIEHAIPGVSYSQNPAAYIGTLDVLYLREDGQAAKVPDFKSHLHIFEADTFQSKLYALFVFQHFPKVQTVIFELVFVRYRNCFRAVSYTRKDIPELMAAVKRARQQQLDLRECPDDAKAFPCRVCAYCPLAANMRCPIRDYNPYLLKTMEERVILKDWLRRQTSINDEPLKKWAEVRGKVVASNDTGGVLEYGQQEKEEITVPLDRDFLRILDEHREATGEDLIGLGKIQVKLSKLRPLLKAQKRKSLRESLEDTVFMAGTKPVLKLAMKTTDEGVVTEPNPWEEE